MTSADQEVIIPVCSTLAYMIMPTGMLIDISGRLTVMELVDGFVGHNFNTQLGTRDIQSKRPSK
jgi:hypothetical protein